MLRPLCQTSSFVASLSKAVPATTGSCKKKILGTCKCEAGTGGKQRDSDQLITKARPGDHEVAGPASPQDHLL
jgi:hypothetical protein